MWVLKWDSGARRSVRIETRFRPERCCCCCSSWVACSALCGVTRRRSAGVVATVVNGLCPFSEPDASSDPGWCGVSGGRSRWRCGGVDLLCRPGTQWSGCGSGADPAATQPKLARRRSCGNQKLWQPAQPQRGAAFVGLTGAAVCALGDTDMRHEAWFVRLGLRAQFARLLAAEMHGRLVAVFWHLRGRKLRCGDSGWWG